MSDFDDAEINARALNAFMRESLPGRGESDPYEVSKLIEDLEHTNYRKIGDVRHAVERTKKAFLVYEQEWSKRTNQDCFAPVGVVRLSLEIADEEFHRRSLSAVPKRYFAGAEEERAHFAVLRKLMNDS